MKSPEKFSRLKIIAGKWSGRWLEFPDTLAIRPTPNRVRETLFNWLMSFVPEAHCLDGFAGSGALALEALSRGAASVCAIEQNPQFAMALQNNAKRFAANKLEIICGSLFAKIPSDKKFDIVFFDPPFQQNLLQPALQLLLDKNLLADLHRVYVEVEKEFDLSQLATDWQILKDQVAGQVRYGLLVKKSSHC